MPEQQCMLIVDDDDVIVLGLADHLRRQGCDIEIARDYTAARTRVGNRSYRVAVVDIVVTGSGADEGVAFLRWIRKTSPDTMVFVLTAYRTAWLEHLAANIGITFLFDKPAPFDEIVDAISMILPASERRSGETRP